MKFYNYDSILLMVNESNGCLHRKFWCDFKCESNCLYKLWGNFGAIPRQFNGDFYVTGVEHIPLAPI